MGKKLSELDAAAAAAAADILHLRTPGGIDKKITGSLLSDFSLGRFTSTVKIGNNTRDAGGDQVITGVGFQPALVQFKAVDQAFANLNWSDGWDDGVAHGCITMETNHTQIQLYTTNSIFIRRTAGNHLTATITALGADGFTITWALVGACVVEYIYLCWL